MMNDPVTDDSYPFDPASYRICDSVGYLMARAKGELSRDVEQEVGALDITHAQASCLVMLAHDRARTVTDLGRELNTDMGSVTRLISRMEKRGLVERRRSDADRRIVDLCVTPAGRALVDQLPAIFCRVLNRRFRGFSEAEIAQFRDMLKRVIANNTG
ncbi:MarR family transcriptional regulator [Cupriavidus gilardii]|uniref:MarR family winged helix-turn-helix transcriptional regulator n=1 Tax=Cupriavidus gilardii TaxID=82541 RepID=UPI001EE5973F|nr:MarR family transcriptional regulator [Cupriavidus gilardii]MCG5261712.1 MarR family transcriptional regulator [Cupriavidus gilardii]MDF9431748.1 MarR family transcriptional regulator [Cupriavidus gilardii]